MKTCRRGQVNKACLRLRGIYAIFFLNISYFHTHLLPVHDDIMLCAGISNTKIMFNLPFYLM